jgi:hypothetical protein
VEPSTQLDPIEIGDGGGRGGRVHFRSGRDWGVGRFRFSSIYSKHAPPFLFCPDVKTSLLPIANLHLPPLVTLQLARDAHPKFSTKHNLSLQLNLSCICNFARAATAPLFGLQPAR